MLAVHLPSTYSAVKKYVRESNLEAEYSVLSKTDYDKSFGNKEDDPTAYVLATSHKTRKIENGNRTVVFDHEALGEKLGQDFNITAFRPEPEEHESGDEGADDDDAVTALSDVSADMREVTVEAAAVSVLEPKPWLQDEGTLEADGTRINYEARGRSNPAKDVEQGETYRVENAQVKTDENGRVYLELRDGVTEVSRVGETKQTGIQSGDDADDEAVADGGSAADADVGNVPSDAKGVNADINRLINILESHGELEQQALVAKAGHELNMEPERTHKVLEKARERGDIMDGPGGGIKSGR